MTDRIIEKEMFASFKETVQLLTTDKLVMVKNQLITILDKLEKEIDESPNLSQYSKHMQKNVTTTLLQIIQTELNYRSPYEAHGDGTYDDYLKFINDISDILEIEILKCLNYE